MTRATRARPRSGDVARQSGPRRDQGHGPGHRGDQGRPGHERQRAATVGHRTGRAERGRAQPGAGQRGGRGVGQVGPHRGWYPYPFIDVSRLGYAKTALNCFWVSLLFLGLAAGAAALDGRLPERDP